VSSIESSSGKVEQNDFYDAAPMEPHLIYQGEVLTDVPFFNMHKESRWLLVRTRSGRPVNEALQNGNLGGTVKVLDSNQSAVQWDLNEGDFAIGRLSKAPVLVLSQTCDCQNKDFIQVAPIFAADTADEYVQRLKGGDIVSAFWIKKHPPEIPEDSFADLELIQAVHKSYRKDLPPERHFRLNHDKTLQLQRALTRYFGRPNSFDVGTDRVPRTGTYLCVKCFYWDGKISKLDLRAGDEFQPCNECRQTKWVPQFGSLQ
jgi:hypothetical protein